MSSGRDVVLESSKELEELSRPMQALRKATGYFVPDSDFKLETYNDGSVAIPSKYNNQFSRSLEDLQNAESRYHAAVAKRTWADTFRRVPITDFTPSELEKQFVYATIKQKIQDATSSDDVESIYQAFNGTLLAAHVQTYLVEACRERMLALEKAKKPAAEDKTDDSDELLQTTTATDAKELMNRLAAATQLQKSSEVLSRKHEGWMPLFGVSSKRRTSFDRELTTYDAKTKEQVRDRLIKAIKELKSDRAFDQLYKEHMSNPYVTGRRRVSILENQYYSHTRIAALNEFRAKAVVLVSEIKDSNEKRKTADYFLNHDAFNEQHNNKYSYLSKAPINNSAKTELLKLRQAASISTLMPQARR